MKPILRMAIFLVAVWTAYGQTSGTNPHGFPKELRNKCQMCHTCTTPTKINPCLIACPRSKESAGYHSPGEGPNMLLMNTMTRQYGPVVFSHRLHAQMSEMSGGCYGCHHYNDTAMRILACADCHPASRAREDISLPDLKGAYHRQCLSCHRAWTGSAACEDCHLDKNSKIPTSEIFAQRAKERKEHPPVPVPQRKLYKTPGQENSVVTFFHTDHSSRFGLACVDCHREESCVRCHDKRRKVAATTARTSGTEERTFDEIHRRCSSCHGREECNSCHRSKPMEAFDHTLASGWALGRFHAKVACQKCHGKTKQFTKVDSQCTGCHTTWAVGAFKHEVTGLKLDEVHSGIDCAECHTANEFSKPPSCSSCHEDKTYPKEKPGKVTGR